MQKNVTFQKNILIVETSQESFDNDRKHSGHRRVILPGYDQRYFDL